ncbi:YheV family putative zinc ribbon protein [Hahella sp. NBU794]|uniref:YheV family putative zinc ribbon protein n=2 Tax=Hahella TaxID=158481 RepID=UPI003D6E89D6
MSTFSNRIYLVVHMVKRFIAGAVCPRCGEMDKIVSYADEDQRQVRECVACGFFEKLREADGPAELQTRVTRPKQAEAQVQTIKFYPRPKKEQ